MHLERMTTLRDFLPTLTPAQRQHFHMRSWFEHEKRGKHSHRVPATEPLEQKHLLTCGSSACALGWAATVPQFRTAGLHLLAHGRFGNSVIHYQGYSGPRAAARFFDISEVAAEFLFAEHIHDLMTPEVVARMIQAVIEADGEVPSPEHPIRNELRELQAKADEEEAARKEYDLIGETSSEKAREGEEYYS